MMVAALEGCTGGVLQPDDLRCEYRTTPLGIDVLQPRLSWLLVPTDEARRCLSQQAYQVQVAGSERSLTDDRPDLWDSGQVQSGQSAHVVYGGRPLASRTKCYWRVRVWDQDGRPSAWSRPSFWTMGLLSPSDWQGQWIGAPEAGFAAPTLRREVQAKGKPVRATADICGLGYYELRINGQRVGDHVLDPGFTDYTKRVLYVTYDVTEHFQAGLNAVGAILGGGWYHLPAGDLFGFHKAPWTAPPKLLLDIDLEFADGTHQAIVSDASWRWCTGPIVFNSLRAGETIDAREDKPLWDQPGFRDDEWKSVQVLQAPAGRLVAQSHPPIRATGSRPAVSISEPRSGVYVFDFGENISGHVRFKASGAAGQEVTLLSNEKLAADGTVDMLHCASHTSGRFQTETFILSGRGVDTFEPRFTYHGFRYVEVRGLTHRPRPEDLTGIWVHTDPEVAGDFACSDQTINAIQKMLVRTQLNNLHGIPTDCPQREKMGWLQDGCVTEEAAICNFDMATFYAKWFADMLDAQDAGGHVPSIVPTCGWGRVNSDGSPGAYADPWWGSAIIRTPWNLYLYYGDRRVLEECYPAMKAYVDYLGRRSRDLVIDWQLGDWLEVGNPATGKKTPVALVSTAAYFHCADLMSRIALSLGRSDDAAAYADLARRIGERINAQFLDASTGLYGPNTQTAQVLALQLGFAPADKRAIVLEGLMKNIQARGGHLSTGIVGTHYLPYALSENGQARLATAVLTAEGYPGFVHMLRSGATTLWEQWDGGNSQDHPTFGCVGAWFYQALAGIRPDVNEPGFRRIIFRPRPAWLTWARARYRSPYGEIVSDWKVADGILTWKIVVPANTRATVYVPTRDSGAVRESGKPASQATGVKSVGVDNGEAAYEVGSGRYRFVAPA